MIAKSDLPQFPVLIHIDTEAIKQEIASISDEREQIGNSLNSLRNDLSSWRKKEVSLQDVLDFLDKGDFERALLTEYGEQNNIDKNIKIEKYQEIFRVPDFSNIVENAKNLKSCSASFLSEFIDLENDSFSGPILTEEDESQINEKHSVYIHNQEDYELYTAFESLCNFINYINIESRINDYGTLFEGRIRDFITIGKYNRHIKPISRGESKAPYWMVDPHKFKK